jgi:photosystem II stability/assembly factor-like uncharacterized protein
MNTTKIIKLCLAILCFNSVAFAQQWNNYGVSLSAANVIVADICTPSKNVAWGILAGFGKGICGGITPYYVKTTNGASWTGGQIPLPTDITPYCITAINKDIAWIAASNIGNNTSGYIYKTINGGASWTQQSNANSMDALRFVHFYDANEGVAVGDSSTFITHDGGTTWVFNGALPVPTATVGSGVTNFLLNAYEVNGNTIWLGDVYGYFYKSTNKGATWTLMPNCIASSVKGIAFKDSLHGIAAAARQAGGGSGGPSSPGDFSVITSDGGITWQDMPITFNSPNIVNSVAKYDVAYIPGTPNTYIASSEYDTWAAFTTITTNGGITWSLLDSTEQHTAISFFDSETGYTGSYLNNFSHGIFKWSGAMPNTIKDYIGEFNVNIFPNPANENITIEIAKNNLFNDYSYQISDLTGKVLLQQKNIRKPTYTINLQSLSSGHYIITLLANNQIQTNYSFTHFH